jgi:glycosyltransferase involved in cell wall biosynthesis
MRIAYICADSGVPIYGCKGASIHVREVTRALVRQGAHVELFATHVDGEVPAGLEKIRVHALPPIPKGERAAREQAALAANDGLHAALESAGPFALVYERYSLWSFAGMEYARAAGTHGLLEVNAPLIEEQAEYRGLFDRRSAERVAERVFGAATTLIAVSEEIAAYLESYPTARGRVHVVPNGVDPARFPIGLQASYACCPGTFTIGFVGSLKPWHGLLMLVEAFAMLHRRDPQIRLLIVGDGPEGEKLMADLLRRGLRDAAHFTGMVPASEVPQLLASMDVAVAPYPQPPHFYFSPLKVYEYMAAGLPVVASRIGQLGTLIEDGVNGLLCPPGDAKALAEALDRLRREPKLCARLGQAARATVLRNHTWEAVAQRILHLAGLEPASHPHGVEVTG